MSGSECEPLDLFVSETIALEERQKIGPLAAEVSMRSATGPLKQS
ncbi:MAG TPA: hypothetical protein VLB68_14705 [Pyrinomonadaceae bacterium]|nr:hypothetical protein [Pyrinomonadaceae bacterium]